MEKYKIEESVEKKLEEELDAFEKREGLKSSLYGALVRKPQVSTRG